VETLTRQAQAGMQITDAQQRTLEALQTRIVSNLKIKALNLAQTLRLVLHDAEGNSPLDYIVEDGKISVFGPAPQ